MDVDYRTFYHLESHLERVVKARFDQAGELGACDLFCIVIWKANRAKSRIAEKIKSKRKGNLDESVRALTREIAKAPTCKCKLEVLIKKREFSLPMASAILSVLYPENFTVYDVRVCGVLDGDHHLLKNKTSMESIWTGYESFVDAVKRNAPCHLSLRDQDRWLWGQSFYEQLAVDVRAEFRKGT